MHLFDREAALRIVTELPATSPDRLSAEASLALMQQLGYPDDLADTVVRDLCTFGDIVAVPAGKSAARWVRSVRQAS